MRAQAFGQAGASFEDLGWNDMGDGEASDRAPRPIAALTPAVAPADEPLAPASPALEQQRVIEDAFGETPASHTKEADAPADKVDPILDLTVPVPGVGRKSAFTLRLDHDRHLRLRLACAVQHRSAQRVVIAALDTYLDSLPDLDTFVRQVPATLGKQV